MVIAELSRRENDFRQPDMERVGMFSEPPFLQYPYSAPNRNLFRPQATPSQRLARNYNKSPFVVSCTKASSALRDGYFSSFARVFSGEGYTDQLRVVVGERRKQQALNISKSPFQPVNALKKPNGAGTFYGTLSGPYSYFSPTPRESLLKQKADPRRHLRNFYTNPAKKGSGAQYVAVTLGKYPEHIPEYKHDRNANRRDIVNAQLALIKARRRNDNFKNRVPDNHYFNANPYKSNILDPFLPTYKSNAKFLLAPRSMFKTFGKPWVPVSQPKFAFSSFPKASNHDPYMGDFLTKQNMFQTREPVNKLGKVWYNCWAAATRRSYYIRSGLRTMVERRLNLHNLDTYRPNFLTPYARSMSRL